MRNLNRCELFSKLMDVNVECSFPDLKKCGFKFYTDKSGNTLGMCQHRVKELGFTECVIEMRVLLAWKIRNDRFRETDSQSKHKQ